VTQLSVLPEIRIARLDAYRMLDDLVLNPAAFGLTNVPTACVTRNIPPFTCGRPDEVLFWDGTHPTKAVYAITAQEAVTALAQ